MPWFSPFLWQVVGPALVTVACFFLSHDPPTHKHMKKRKNKIGTFNINAWRRVKDTSKYTPVTAVLDGKILVNVCGPDFCGEHSQAWEHIAARLGARKG